STSRTNTWMSCIWTKFWRISTIWRSCRPPSSGEQVAVNVRRVPSRAPPRAVCVAALRAAAADRPIGDAGVADAVGQALHRLVAAIAEVVVARVVDRPAAFAVAELEQSTAAPVGDWHLLGARLLARKGFFEHFLLSEDVDA